MQRTRNLQELVTGEPSDNLYGKGSSSPRYFIDPDWATSLYPVVDTCNLTALQDTVKTAGLWNSSEPIDIKDTTYILEFLLCIIYADGLSRRDFGSGISETLYGKPDLLDLDYDHTKVMECGDWCKHLLPSRKYAMGYGGAAFDSEQATNTKFVMRADANGWAYSTRCSAAKLSIVACLIHSVINHISMSLYWAGHLRKLKQL